jgi:hypothetical protein
MLNLNALNLSNTATTGAPASGGAPGSTVKGAGFDAELQRAQQTQRSATRGDSEAAAARPDPRQPAPARAAGASRQDPSQAEDAGDQPARAAADRQLEAEPLVRGRAAPRRAGQRLEAAAEARAPVQHPKSSTRTPAVGSGLTEAPADARTRAPETPSADALPADPGIMAAAAGTPQPQVMHAPRAAPDAGGRVDARGNPIVTRAELRSVQHGAAEHDTRTPPASGRAAARSAARAATAMPVATAATQASPGLALQPDGAGDRQPVTDARAEATTRAPRTPASAAAPGTETDATTLVPAALMPASVDDRQAPDAQGPAVPGSLAEPVAAAQPAAGGLARAGARSGFTADSLPGAQAMADARPPASADPRAGVQSLADAPASATTAASRAGVPSRADTPASVTTAAPRAGVQSLADAPASAAASRATEAPIAMATPPGAPDRTGAAGPPQAAAARPLAAGADAREARERIDPSTTVASEKSAAGVTLIARGSEPTSPSQTGAAAPPSGAARRADVLLPGTRMLATAQTESTPGDRPGGETTTLQVLNAPAELAVAPTTTPQADATQALLGVAAAEGRRADAPQGIAPHASPVMPPGALAQATIDAPLGSPAFDSALGARIAVFARDGIEQARLNVHPAELGPISVQLALDGTKVRVDMTADVGTTRQALEQSLPALASALRDAGLTLTGGGVFQQWNQGRDDPGASAQQAGGGRLGEPALDAAAAVAVAAVPIRRREGLIDLFA